MQATVLITVSAILWLAAGLCAPSALHGRRRLLFWFLAVFALTMTLQPKPIYDGVDSLLGDINVTYFLFHALAIVAIALVDVIVQQAVSPGGITKARKLGTAIIASAIIATQAVLFFGSDWRVTDNISRAFVSRWDYTAYASTTWIAMAIFGVSVAYACVSDMRQQPRGITRISLGFVTLGCLGVLGYALISLTSAFQSVLNPDFTFQGWSRFAYTLTFLLSPISLAVGLCLTATADGLSSVRKTYRDLVLLWRITPIWNRLLSTSPDLSIERALTPLQLLVVHRPGVHLYRRHVEIRDSLLLNPAQAVSLREQSVIDRAERQTQAPTRKTPKPQTDRTQSNVTDS
ncbi:hypothetical protein JF66_04040 [Cryobacterium sp. MLB-32]|uniref:DUF6545 domain-containing protein n=2 Tax=Cryobacterium sp. MLB-32 TaxID=1529318 RepID=UPI0004E68DFE|nr:hypothetical protein JF66_04040 [Cryobacterium sp. MLB-32]